MLHFVAGRKRSWCVLALAVAGVIAWWCWPARPPERGATLSPPPSRSQSARPPEPAVAAATVTPVAVQNGREAGFLWDALREALASGEPDLLQAALETFSRYLREHPNEKADMLARFKREQALARQIHPLAAGSVRWGLPEARHLLSAAAMDLAQDSRDAQLRLWAVTALGNFPESNSEALALVQWLSRTDSDMQVRHAGLGTMAVWLAGQPDFREQIIQGLIDIIQAPAPREIRADALMILLAHSPQLTAPVTASIDSFLQDKPTAEDRLLVALGVGRKNESARDYALGLLKTAFEEEGRVDMRRNIVTEMVRLGHAQAVPWLERLPAGNPIVAADIQDYVALLKAGTLPNELDALKNQRSQQRGLTP
ncbi:MAG: hypothetical protein HZA31_08320 [Opitutae bacterium]|nr:hypothetical protein [Opitutae bacterium]